MNSEIEKIIDLHNNKPNLLKKINAPKIGWVSIYTPEEIIWAAGAVPYRISGESCEDTMMAKSHIHGNICSYMLSCYEELWENEENLCDGVVITNTCDTRGSLYHACSHFFDKKFFIHSLDMPRVVDSDTKAYFKNRIEIMISAIEEHFECEITENSLKEAIFLCSRTRELLSKLQESRKTDKPPITGTQAIDIVKTAMSGLKGDFNKRLEAFLSKADFSAQDDNAGKPRVLISGSYFDHKNITRFIEEKGGIIVCEDISNGLKYFENNIDPSGEPIQAIADYYLEKATCASMLNSEKRFDHMWNIINKYNVHCVIFFVLKFCDNNLMDFPYQKKRLNKKGIPVLLVELERIMENIEQVKTRIQAFLETSATFLHKK
ncbi:MAG: 2-hydroxyacyl-CoA dehydratase [bacterium]|nr:2-hydroxyacyl-CoA dehydratase [bacterium]